MITPNFPSSPVHRLLIAAVGLSLAAAACAPATPAVTAKASPLSPTKPAVAATQAVKPTAAPTLAPTKAPTAAPKPTVAPTVQATALPPTAVATAEPTEAAIAPAKPGVMQAIGDLEVTPNQIKTTSALGTQKPAAGHVFVEITLEVKNSSKVASATFDPATLILVDPATGLQYKAADLKAISTGLASQTLKPGSQAAGTIVFEVPEKTAGLELQFSVGNQRALWSTAG